MKSNQVRFWNILCVFCLGYTVQLDAQLFSENSSAVGISHIMNHREFLGGGAVVFDYDNDGWEDIYLSSGWSQDQLYRNNGDGTYREVSDEANLRDTRLFYTTGAIAGDIDNDGDSDLFVSTRQSTSGNNGTNLLYRNNGDGTFDDIWMQRDEGDRFWAMGALFIDFDNDGLLDIYSLGYVDELHFLRDSNDIVFGFVHDCFENRFYKNKGAGNFEEMTSSLGLVSTGCALACLSTDYDNDGDMDIYLVNDFGEFVVPNQLFRNDYNIDGTFTDIAMETGSDIGIYGMGIAAGDIDNDQDLDLYVTNIGRNVLLERQGDGYSDISTERGVENYWTNQDSLRTTSWGCNFFDFDNDTDLDLFVSNGIIPADGFIRTGPVDPNKLFQNDGTGNFEDISSEAGIDWHTIGRGSAIADFDKDGDLDIIQNVLAGNIEGQLGKSLYFENETSPKNWIRIKLEGTKVNRDAIGSKVYIYANGQSYMREVEGGSGHSSQNSLIAHFGLGDMTSVDSIKVIWTGGQHTDVVENPSINSLIQIKESMSSPVVDISTVEGISIYPNPATEYVTLEISDTDISIEKIYLIDNLGRKTSINTNKNQQKTVIDVSDFPVGLYILNVIDGETIYTSKIQKL